ncbi:MAG: hypothetical protein JWM76_4743 [Pseudonocardiales bacterium]|nr:hypothetical protein [Pseudonocardiales bacterium]
MRKSAKLCLYAVVIAGVVGGTAAWATTDKAVAVSIDGQTKTIHTRSGTVGGALKGAHITTNEHDAIAPATSAKLADNTRIVIRKGRLLHLTVDGNKVDVWTTASTVDEALAALGYGTDKTVSVSRSTRLPLSATELTLLTPKTVTITVDGATRTVTSTAKTVSEMLAVANVQLGANDQLSALGTDEVAEGQAIIINRVTISQATEAQEIPFPTTSTNDATAAAGSTVVVTPGKAGSQQVLYQLTYVNGVLTEKKALTTQVLAAPIPQVQKVGTMKAPVATPTASAPATVTPTGTAQQIAAQMVASRGWGTDQFSCLVSLWNRESGWNTHAANGSGAYGIPQALPGSKMASAGPDWQNNAATQITWGLGYISGRYGTPCGAWGHSQSSGWY